MFRHFREKFRGGPLARISFSSSMWTTDHTANYSQTAEYVLEESRRKKRRVKKTRTLERNLRSVAYSWWKLRVVRLQRSICNHGHQLQHYSRYINLSSTVDRLKLSDVLFKYASLSPVRDR